MNEPTEPNPIADRARGVRLRLLGALLAVAAGTTAVVLAVLLVRSALS